MRGFQHWRWHLDGMYVKSTGEMVYLWRAMLRFRRMKTLQTFSSIHASVHNLFKQERHLVDRDTYREHRSAALAEWRAVMS